MDTSSNVTLVQLPKVIQEWIHEIRASTQIADESLSRLLIEKETYIADSKVKSEEYCGTN